MFANDFFHSSNAEVSALDQAVFVFLYLSWAYDVELVRHEKVQSPAPDELDDDRQERDRRRDVAEVREHGKAFDQCLRGAVSRGIVLLWERGLTKSTRRGRNWFALFLQ